MRAALAGVREERLGLLRAEAQVDGSALGAQARGETRRGGALLGLQVADADQVRARGGVREAEGPQELADDDVAEAEPDGGRGLAADRGEEVVVAAAAEDGAELALRVERLEDDAGVVGEAADDGDVEDDLVADAVDLEQREKLPDAGDRGGVRAGDGGGLVERRDVHQVERLAAGLVVEPLAAHDLLDRLARHLALLVEREEGAGVEPLVDAEPREQLREERAGGEADAVGLVRDAHAAHRVDRGGEDLGLAGDVLLADHVEVELVVFALTALGHALVAEALGDAEPLEGELERALALRDHARERGRHLRPERDVAAGLVLERVDLVLDLLAGLALEQLERLDDARVVVLEAVRDRGRAPGVEDPVAEDHVLGVEVAHAARGGEVHFGLTVLGSHGHAVRRALDTCHSSLVTRHSSLLLRDPVAEELAGAEADDAVLGHLVGTLGVVGVAADAGLVGGDGEDAEVAELAVAAADEGVGDGVEDDADDVEGDGLLQVRLRGDGADELALGHQGAGGFAFHGRRVYRSDGL